MKLIVEGPDGSGKTTIIEKLGLTRRHLKSLRGGVGGQAYDQGTEMVPGGWGGKDPAAVAYIRQLIEAPDGTAFDRFYLSELVYGPILRGQSAIRETDVDLVRRVAGLMKIYTVVCLPSFETTFQNVITPGRERPSYQTPEFLRAAYDGWKRVLNFRTEDVIIFNYETDDIHLLQQLFQSLTKDVQ
jgi:hypothetical protein